MSFSWFSKLLSIEHDMKNACTFFRSLTRRIHSILWEQRCRVCGIPCPPGNALPLCPDCAQALAPLQKSFCPCCGQILEKTDKRRFFCRECLLDPPPWQEIHLLGAYEHLLRELLIDCKFHGNLAAAHLVGTLLARSMPKSFHDAPHILVPVPLSEKRLQERGFNQVLELARPVARRFSFPLVPEALSRTKETRPQSKLSKRERRINVRGAFAAIPENVAQKHIILMDDVMSTGSTLRQAALTLFEAGAASICVLIAARTPKHSTPLF